MKRRLKTLMILVLTVLMLPNCKKGFLDRAATTQQQDADIFTSFAMVDQVVNNLYRKMRGTYTYLGGYNMAAAADEAKDASNWMGSMSFNNGSWSGNNNPIGNTWREGYVAIRQANTILENVAKYQTPDDPNNPGFLENRIGEVYFLRAYYLFELIRQFGGVIIANNSIEQTDNIALNKPRSTYDSCVAQIVKDCDEAYGRVAFGYQATQVGRVTKGACLALKARALLYSASPLWAQAGKTSYLGDINTGATATDPVKWQAAADAAKAVIDLRDAGNALVYDIEPTLAARQNMFKSTTLQSREVIFVRMREADQAYDTYIFPKGYGGWSGCAPVQNLVDDYEMNNGLPISDPLSTYSDDAPYTNRDPRFYTDILYNGANWKTRNVETYAGGRDEQKTETDFTRTGYFCRKLADESITPGQSGSRLIHGINFRLTEMYLSYAEALNEYAPGHADILIYLNKIRVRAGQQPIVAVLSQPEMRKRIQNERRIELSFENHRFWDVRRWKIAETNQKEIFGMRPVVDATKPGGYRYVRFKVEDRLWRNAMYVIPITTDETLRNPNLKQNEGW